MSATPTCLVEAAFVPAAETALFTAGAATVIDRLNSYGVLAGDLTLRLVKAGDVAGDAHTQKKKTFVIGDSYQWPEIAGQTLAPGDSISGIASVPSAVNLRVSGRVLT